MQIKKIEQLVKSAKLDLRGVAYAYAAASNRNSELGWLCPKRVKRAEPSVKARYSHIAFKKSLCAIQVFFVAYGFVECDAGNKGFVR